MVYISNINMPVCLTCGFSTFSCHAGLYFCEECGTQFKDHRTEEQDDEYVSTNISNISEIKTARHVKKKVVAFEHAWLTIEAFNIVLYHQVQALIKLGASPHLKDAVLQLWAYYLQKCEISFKENAVGDDWIPALGLSPRNRDVQILCGAKSVTRSRKRKKRKCQLSSKRRKTDTAIIENSSAGEETFSDISITDESNDSFNSSGSQLEFPLRTKSLCKKSSFCRKKFKKIGAKSAKKIKYAIKRNLPDYMTLPKTLSFCYLGLLLVEDHFLISDIIRFVEQGHLPYMGARTLLPTEMKCKDSDWHMLLPTVVPTMNCIISTTISLAKFLRLPKLKHLSLLQIVVRYIKDLNLPFNFISYIHKIFSKIRYPDYWYPTNSKMTVSALYYEVKALALLMVGLKLLFGLNETSENQHSKIVRKINTLLPNLNLFVWDEWYYHLKCKADFLKSQNLSHSKVTEFIDIESLVAYYYNTIKEWTSVEKSRPKEKAFDPEYRTSLRTAFSNFVIKPTFQNFIPPVSCFPLSSELLYKIGIAKSSLQYSDSPFYDWSILGKDFSLTSVQYSHHYHEKNSSFSPEVNKLLSRLKKKFYKSYRRKERKNINASRLKKKFYKSYHRKERKNINVSDDVCTDVNNLHLSYWYLQCTRRNVGTVYKSVPKTFNWLMNFMSEYIRCNVHDLFYEIWVVEKNIFKL